MALSASSGTPKGTPPQPTRRSTKHKTVAFGKLLMEKHAAKHARKIQRALEAKAAAPATTVVKKAKK